MIETPRAPLAAAILIAVAVLMAFYPALGDGFVNYDDDRYVTQNPAVRGGLTAAGLRWAWTATHAANWHPLTWISHMVDWELYGPWAGGHHLTNVGLHALGAVLLLWAFFALTGAVYRSALVAALFAVHPLHVESVAWIAERKDVLSTLFLALTLILYARYARQVSRRRLALVIVAFTLGLLSKPMLVTLPYVLLLLDYWWPR